MKWMTFKFWFSWLRYALSSYMVVIMLLGTVMSAVTGNILSMIGSLWLADVAYGRLRESDADMIQYGRTVRVPGADFLRRFMGRHEAAKQRREMKQWQAAATKKSV